MALVASSSSLSSYEVAFISMMIALFWPYFLIFVMSLPLVSFALMPILSDFIILLFNYSI